MQTNSKCGHLRVFKNAFVIERCLILEGSLKTFISEIKEQRLSDTCARRNTRWNYAFKLERICFENSTTSPEFKMIILKELGERYLEKLIYHTDIKFLLARFKKRIWKIVSKFLQICWPILWKKFLSRVSFTAWKVPKYWVISGPYFPVFGPEITPYLDTFHTIFLFS